jgi:hypothetical protein
MGLAPLALVSAVALGAGALLAVGVVLGRWGARRPSKDEVAEWAFGCKPNRPRWQRRPSTDCTEKSPWRSRYSTAMRAQATPCGPTW